YVHDDPSDVVVVIILGDDGQGRVEVYDDGATAWDVYADALEALAEHADHLPGHQGCISAAHCRAQAAQARVRLACAELGSAIRAHAAEHHREQLARELGVDPDFLDCVCAGT